MTNDHDDDADYDNNVCVFEGCFDDDDDDDVDVDDILSYKLLVGYDKIDTLGDANGVKNQV